MMRPMRNSPHSLKSTPYDIIVFDPTKEQPVARKAGGRKKTKKSKTARKGVTKAEKPKTKPKAKKKNPPQILTAEGVVMRNRIRWILVVALTIVLVYRLYKLGRPEDLVQRAISVCEPCGLTEEGVLRFIDNKARSGLSRSELFKAWEDTYDDPGDLETARELCADCTNAILDAALGQRATIA